MPAKIGRLSNLRVLDLSANALEQLPEFGQLARLQVLALSSNFLTTLPAGLGQLTSLQKLDLTQNPLTDRCQSSSPRASPQSSPTYKAWLRRPHTRHGPQ